MSLNPNKKLYDYQLKAIDHIFEKFANKTTPYNLVYQLPTGGGKTIIFSEITRRYLESNPSKKVVILTHRIELCKQTSNTLAEIGVPNGIIDMSVRDIYFQHEYKCFVAMVETLKNRLQDNKLELQDIGLVIVDEAHYNSFRKLFIFFSHCNILGVTATPLSSNVRLPMHTIYNELIVGEPILKLIETGFLAKVETYSFHVGLEGLKIGTNGDYTVKSSELLYNKDMMQYKLLNAYREKSLGRKTLIFNNGIATSYNVSNTFKQAGYKIKHLDNTTSKENRNEIIRWFRETDDAILTSVGILTTGFDEPSVETIIINRATRSVTLYYQMIGRGSRIFGNKKTFRVLDLGNNVARFGVWGTPLDWSKIFRKPDVYLNGLKSDEEIERGFVYQLPEKVREKFSKTVDVTFNIAKRYSTAIENGEKSNIVLEESLAQHLKMCIENSEDIFMARALIVLLKDDIQDRIKKYSFCITKNSRNYVEWLKQEYTRKLTSKINRHFL